MNHFYNKFGNPHVNSYYVKMLCMVQYHFGPFKSIVWRFWGSKAGPDWVTYICLVIIIHWKTAVSILNYKTARNG